MMPVTKSNMTLRGGPISFYVRRARRILPPFYVAMGMSLLLEWLWIGHKTGTHWDDSLPVTRNAVLSAIFMLQNVWYVSKINHVFWSVAVEWQIYFWFPFFIACWKRTGALKSLGTTLIVVYALTFLLHHGQTFVHDRNVQITGFAPILYGLFCIGMFAAGIVYGDLQTFAELRTRVSWASCALLSAAIVLLVTHLGRGPADLFVGISSACVIIDCALNSTGPLSRIFSWAPLVFVGTFAYSLYLIHAPLIQILWKFVIEPLKLGPVTSYWLLLFAGTPIISGVAYLFFLAFERPFLNTRKGAPSIEEQTSLSPAP